MPHRAHLAGAGRGRERQASVVLVQRESAVQPEAFGIVGDRNPRTGIQRKKVGVPLAAPVLSLVPRRDVLNCYAPSRYGAGFVCLVQHGAHPHHGNAATARCGYAAKGHPGRQKGNRAAN